MAAEERKLAIVQAALPLFAAKGFAQTTTKDLAKAAGVSEPLLYRHFPSKEALYLEIQDFTCRSTDPVVRRLSQLKPSASTLVHLLYYLMRALVLGKPAGAVEWKLRHRLMLNSILEDGAFARLLYQTRFEAFCRQMAECLQAAVTAGEAVEGPVSYGNGARFAHHVAAWLAAASLPESQAMEYHVGREELLQQAVWFGLRGMGLTDRAISTYYNPSALALLFEES
jgi:TetR/AcrR family transcriptional regulator, transcriptional repressor of aconitase